MPLLCPEGHFSELAAIDLLCEQLHHCGGDLARVIDNPFPSLDRYLSHIARMPIVRDGRQPSMVLLSGDSPRNAVLARRTLERGLPALASAVWVLHLPEGSTNRFAAMADSHGELDDELDRAPIWTAHGGGRYLILSPRIRDLRLLPGRVREVQLLSEKVEAPPHQLSAYLDEECPTTPREDFPTLPRNML